MRLPSRAALIARALARLPPDERAAIEALLPASWFKGRRDDVIRQLAEHSSSWSSGRAMAAEIASDLAQHATSAGWRDRGRAPPADPVRALRHHVLTLNGGRAPSAETCRRALSGLGPVHFRSGFEPVDAAIRDEMYRAAELGVGQIGDRRTEKEAAGGSAGG